MSGEVALPVGPGVEPGTIIGVPVVIAGREARQPASTRNVVVADGRQSVEQETNDAPSQAQELPVPGGVSGRIGHDGDVDFYRFRRQQGRDGRSSRSTGVGWARRVDSIIEVLDAQGEPVPRAVLRPVDQTEVAFRDHPSTSPTIRLTHWDNLAVNDYLWFGRELMRIQALPRNLDDDCVFWGQQGQRIGWLETTPEQHPMGQLMYKVEIHPPGTVFPPSGVPTTTLPYQQRRWRPDVLQGLAGDVRRPGRRRIPGPGRGRPRPGRRATTAITWSCAGPTPRSRYSSAPRTRTSRAGGRRW